MKPKILKVFIIVIALLLIIRLLLHNSSIFYLKRPYLPFSLHLNKQDLVLVRGEEFRLFVYGINKRVSFSSSNFRVAGVNIFGKVTAYQPGKTFIKAKVDNKILKCRVRVIEINKNHISLNEGDTYRLRVKGIMAVPKWASSNKEIAQVSGFGKVTAKTKGKTTITAEVKGKVVKCVVEVI
ncbi:MAG: Ig-like domain-containing protein [Clostridiales bacterium]|nr:Ig-like domain-containing protein [Clostridiales bacterium]